MALNIKSNNDTTIEDYILSCSKIPLCSNRNRNGEHVIGEFRMVVSETCPAAFRTEGATIDIYPLGGSYAQFMGVIDKSEYLEDTRTFRLSVRSNISKLLLKKISTANLDTRFKNGTGIEYNSSDEYGYTSVQVLFAIEEMFIDAGISNFNFHTTFKDIEVVTIMHGGTPRIIEFEHLRIDPEMFWNINQSIASHNLEMAKGKYGGARVTYWDFINNFLSIFHCHLYLSADGTTNEYRIANISDFPPVSIDDDDIYSSKITKAKAQGQGWNVDHKFNSDRNKYRVYGTNYTLTSHTFEGGEEGTSIPIYSNLIYFYHRWWDAGYNVIWGGNDDGTAYSSGRCVLGSGMAFYYQLATENSWSALTRESPLTNKVNQFRENNIIVKDQIMETVYET